MKCDSKSGFVRRRDPFFFYPQPNNNNSHQHQWGAVYIYLFISLVEAHSSSPVPTAHGPRQPPPAQGHKVKHTHSCDDLRINERGQRHSTGCWNMTAKAGDRGGGSEGGGGERAEEDRSEEEKEVVVWEVIEGEENLWWAVWAVRWKWSHWLPVGSVQTQFHFLSLCFCVWWILIFRSESCASPLTSVWTGVMEVCVCVCVYQTLLL